MKTDLHPKYYPEAKVTCSCGNSFTTGSTQPAIEVDICSNCHPFFTGEMKFVDTQGRVEKFEKMRAKAAKLQKSVTKKSAKKQKSPPDVVETPKTLKEMLSGMNVKPSAKQAKQ